MNMKKLLAACLLVLSAVDISASEPLPELQKSNIEYPSPKAAYDALRQDPGMTFSTDSSGWTVASNQATGVIWSFAPNPSFPVVVKRTLLVRDGQMFIAMDVLCRGAKDACDDVVRRYEAINQQARRAAPKNETPRTE